MKRLTLFILSVIFVANFSSCDESSKKCAGIEECPEKYPEKKPEKEHHQRKW